MIICIRVCIPIDVTGLSTYHWLACCNSLYSWTLVIIYNDALFTMTFIIAKIGNTICIGNTMCIGNVICIGNTICILTEKTCMKSHGEIDRRPAKFGKLFFQKKLCVIKISKNVKNGNCSKASAHSAAELRFIFNAIWISGLKLVKKSR